MKLNVIVYSKSVAKGEKSFDLSALFSLCNKHSVYLSNFIIKDEYDFELTEKLLDKPLIIFGEKKDLELFEINISYKFSSEREVLYEKCIHLKNGLNVCFIPLDNDCLVFANNFISSLNTNGKVSIFRLFGKSGRLVSKMLMDNNIDMSKCRVVENDLLCDIYLYEPVGTVGVTEMEQKIGKLFLGDIYSHQLDMSLKDVAINLLKLHKQKLDIIEPFTCGAITKCFSEEPSVIYEGLIPVSNRALTKEGNMTGFDFQNGGECSIQTNTLLCKSRLSQLGADVVLVLTAKPVDGGYQEILSIADKSGVTTIKTHYKDSLKNTINFSVNWALFNLVKKLTQKDFANN